SVNFLLLLFSLREFEQRFGLKGVYLKVLLVSNMYPSAANPGYGVFVKNFEDSLVERGVVFDRVVIVGRSRSALVKLFKYLVFFLRVCFLYCFRRYDCVYVHYIAHSLILLVPLVGL